MAAVSHQEFTQLLQTRNGGDFLPLKKLTPRVYKDTQKAMLPRRLPSGNGGLDHRRHCMDAGKLLRSKTLGQMISQYQSPDNMAKGCSDNLSSRTSRFKLKTR
jgi:hypothetical protein